VDLLGRLRIDVPVAQAGMTGVAGARVAGAVAEAGWLGTIGLTAEGVGQGNSRESK
jgi:NAD(P)H-dependent flavin oxidoreductase YrpB (nitropropane dioxygenase family)